MSKKVYTIKATEEVIEKLLAMNYTIESINEGCLGLGDMVLEPPVGGLNYYIIREVYINPWSSGQSIRTCKKLSKAVLRELELAEEEQIRRELEEA